jgi:hypothetical protein
VGAFVAALSCSGPVSDDCYAPSIAVVYGAVRDSSGRQVPRTQITGEAYGAGPGIWGDAGASVADSSGAYRVELRVGAPGATLIRLFAVPPGYTGPYPGYFSDTLRLAFTQNCGRSLRYDSVRVDFTVR